MTFHRKSPRALPWLVVAGLLAALAVPVTAAAKPTPGTSSASQRVQIGGQLVPASQVSSFYSQLGGATPDGSTPQLVRIGGQLVPASQVSSFYSQLGGATPDVSTSSGDGFNWSALSGGLVGFVLLLGASGYVLRSRRRLVTTA